MCQHGRKWLHNVANCGHWRGPERETRVRVWLQTQTGKSKSNTWARCGAEAEVGCVIEPTMRFSPRRPQPRCPGRHRTCVRGAMAVSSPVIVFTRPFYQATLREITRFHSNPGQRFVWAHGVKRPSKGCVREKESWIHPHPTGEARASSTQLQQFVRLFK